MQRKHGVNDTGGTLADAGYSQPENYEMVAAMGATPWIDFKDDGHGHSPVMDRMRAIWAAQSVDPTWNDNYGERVIVECVNSALKRTRYRVVRARTEKGRATEVIAMCIVYNLCRLAAIRENMGLVISFADARAMRVLEGGTGTTLPEAA